jgi:acetyl-CoA carboxylase biotin carboxylase subunit
VIPFRRLLVANRGEIALRIIRACRELEIESVAVYSAADRGALHVRAATHAVEIGPAPAAESYLSVDRILSAARGLRADAIHPGYGFLSERPDLARACETEGLVFVGPTASAIERMGSKIAARDLMARAGVPVVPGETPEDQSDGGVARAVDRIGYPALIKASAGGGGKGMRVVRSPDGTLDAVEAARREALSGFGDGALYVERFLEGPRHVEIQIFGDATGRVVHLFERECSVQRRHQKVIEESPSPAITPRVRAEMGAAAVRAAEAVGYRNAGTVEFLVEGARDEARFYFLEMNTRLQVEHPVTELVAGVDLVRAQITVAAGEPLPWRQEQLTQRGHAIECRVYAEDPVSFLPQAGRILLYREPVAPGIRIDAGVGEGTEVPVFYDPLLAKLVAYGETRDVAIARARAALADYAILGLTTNVAFLRRVLDHRRFRSGMIDIGFVGAEQEDLTRHDSPGARAAALAAAVVHEASGSETPTLTLQQASAPDPWTSLPGWRN